MMFPNEQKFKSYIAESQQLMVAEDSPRPPEYYQGVIDGICEALNLLYALDPDDVLEYLEDL